jgi:hypothetical protein
VPSLYPNYDDNEPMEEPDRDPESPVKQKQLPSRKVLELKSPKSIKPIPRTYLEE